MQKTDVHEYKSWLMPALLGVAIVTLWRIGMLAVDQTDLFVDEAQYWLWGQEMAFGYYSKPPMIGWVIRAFTELGGSDAPFWVRLPGSLFHGATALLLGAIAARLSGARAGMFVAWAYVSLPVVTVGSYLISTDTVMFPFLALALLCWLRLLEDTSGARARTWAIAAGAAVGLAFLSKYAAIYFVLGAGLSALFLRATRPGWAHAGLSLAAFALVISPNVAWNLLNGLSTIEHTLDNADWVRDPGTKAQLNVTGLAEFFGAQFIVFGPVFFASLLWICARGGAGVRRGGLFLIIAMPIIVLVCAQALLSGAYANWAAAAYLPALLVVVPWLLKHSKIWIWLSLAVHGAFALFLPLAAANPTALRAGQHNDFLLARYIGRTRMSEQIFALAKQEATVAIVADNRDILADLFYFGRDRQMPVFAKPQPGRAPNHYVLRYAFKGQAAGQVLFVTGAAAPPTGCQASKITRLAPENGAYRRGPQNVFVVNADCWGG
ncbi:MAG: 4-amino-4-deoxy-L-arabinose transferase-like glycosyltransferase [Paracoccaceae bacterium]|jgi:4-amino-4-deoxy-L-arabinose transferase-like glycosyltransferase